MTCNRFSLEPDAQAKFELPRSTQCIGPRLEASSIRQKALRCHSAHRACRQGSHRASSDGNTAWIRRSQRPHDGSGQVARK